MNDNLKEMYEFQAPYSLLARLESIKEKDEFIIDTRYRKAQEAWVMSQFCIGYEDLMNLSASVKMSLDEPADATIKLRDGEIIDYQITESLNPIRKRDKDYKNWIRQGKPLSLRPYTPLEMNECAELIRDAISKKLRKHYNIKAITNLLIYVDFDRNGLDLDLVHEKCRDLNIHPFKEVWLFLSTFVDGVMGCGIAQLLPAKNGFFTYPIEED